MYLSKYNFEKYMNENNDSSQPEISVVQTPTEIPRQNKHEYHFYLGDSFLIGIGIICLTAIIITWLRRNRGE